MSATGVQVVATAMLPELPELGAGVAAAIGEQMPQIAQTDSDALVLASCQANSAALLDGLVRGVAVEKMAPSPEVMASTRELFAHGLTLPVVLRAYRLGIAWWCTRWAASVTRHGPADADLVDVVARGTSFLLGWLELVTDRLSQEHHDEAERLAREGTLARLEAVRHALEDPELDVTGASQRLGYELEGRHLALVLHSLEWPGEGGLDATARELAAALGEARPLVVDVDTSTTWCWVSLAPGAVAKLGAPDGPVLVGSGRPAGGLAGFRRSHQEAGKALRVAQLSGRGGPAVTRFDAVELTALCTGDAGACRAFVRGELGALAADDDASRRLRATLEAFLAEHLSFRATGKRLGIHHNTVRYRLAAVERLLGRPVAERRLSLELALHLSSRLRPWILADGA